MRGSALAYFIILIPVIMGMLAISVDLGRVTLAKAQAQSTADAAARYAAMGMASSNTKQTTAYNQARLVCAESRVDGRVPTLASTDVTVGIWDSVTRTFTPSSDATLINAARVQVNQSIGATGSTPMFAQAMGLGAKPVSAASIAMAVTLGTEVIAPSSGNLWLAGMPDNTSVTNLQNNAGCYDNSGTSANPKQRPITVSLTSLGLQPGDNVSFEGLSGTGSNGGGGSGTGPDGNQGWMVALGNSAPNSVPSNNANGIANVRAPISSVMAVFLDDYAPNTSAAPSGLDFGTAAQRDYRTLSPQLKQPFFIGDGKTSTGEVQRIRVPTGATRVYLGMMDAWQWNDNVGSFRMNFYRATTISTVK